MQPIMSLVCLFNLFVSLLIHLCPGQRSLAVSCCSAHQCPPEENYCMCVCVCVCVCVSVCEREIETHVHTHTHTHTHTNYGITSSPNPSLSLSLSIPSVAPVCRLVCMCVNEHACPTRSPYTYLLPWPQGRTRC